MNLTKMTKLQIKRMVLDIYRNVYGKNQTEKEMLRTDPNIFDKDPSTFYELLMNEFNLNDKYPDFGGSIASTIDFIFKNQKQETGIEEENDKHLFSFFDNYGHNFKTLSKQNLKMYLNMFSMMEGRTATQKVIERLQFALNNDSWDDLLIILSKVKQKKELLNLESLKRMTIDLHDN